jgi:flagellar protein FliO/FliZ
VIARALQTLLFLFVFYPLQLSAEGVTQSEKLARVEPFSVMSMLNMVMGLIVVIALILGLAWVLRKYGRLPVSNQVDMKVLGGLSLGTRERAVLIQVEGQRLLLGVAPGRVETLHVMDEAQSSAFKQSLTEAMEKPS